MLTRTITGLIRRYEDILEPKDIYSLIALTAYHNKYYGICSRAFISKFKRAEVFVRYFRFYSSSTLTQMLPCLLVLSNLQNWKRCRSSRIKTGIQFRISPCRSSQKINLWILNHVYSINILTVLTPALLTMLVLAVVGLCKMMALGGTHGRSCVARAATQPMSGNSNVIATAHCATLHWKLCLAL